MDTNRPERRDVSPKGEAVRRVVGDLESEGELLDAGWSTLGVKKLAALAAARGFEEGKLYGQRIGLDGIDLKEARP